MNLLQHIPAHAPCEPLNIHWEWKLQHSAERSLNLSIATSWDWIKTTIRTGSDVSSDNCANDARYWIALLRTYFLYLPQLTPVRMRQMMYTDKYLGQTITQEMTAVKDAARKIVFLLPILSAIWPNIKFPINHPSQNREEETFCRKLLSHISSN
jgi:hypothetical protein